MSRSCPHCGCALPDLADAFCSECHGPLEDEVYDSASPLAITPTKTAAPVGPPFKNHDDVPPARRSGLISACVLIGFFCLPPFLWFACLICLTGDVYYNRVGKDGYLETWWWGNKVVAGVLLVVQIIGILFRIYGVAG